MIENVLRSIGGVGAYGVISICLFFAVFTGMLIWVAFLKRPYLEEMKSLPLHDDPADTRTETKSKHRDSHE